MAEFSDAKSGAYCMCTREKCSDECRTYRRFRPKPITNADRITSNVESLAKFIVEIAGCAECEEMHGFRMCDVAANKACEDCWLDWLRREVDNG